MVPGCDITEGCASRSDVPGPFTQMERGSEPLDADEWARTDDVEQLRHEQYPRSATDSAVTESEYHEYVRKGAAGELP